MASVASGVAAWGALGHETVGWEKRPLPFVKHLLINYVRSVAMQVCQYICPFSFPKIYYIIFLIVSCSKSTQLRPNNVEDKFQ